MLGGIAKDAGLSAAQEAHRAADGALDKIDHETIPAAKAAAEAIVGQAVGGIYAVVVDLLNRLHGAELPIDVTATMTLRVTGKIGALKLSVPEQMESQSVEVKG